MARVGEPCVTLDGSTPCFALMMQNCNTPSETSYGGISLVHDFTLLCKKVISCFPLE